MLAHQGSAGNDAQSLLGTMASGDSLILSKKAAMDMEASSFPDASSASARKEAIPLCSPKPRVCGSRGTPDAGSKIWFARDRVPYFRTEKCRLGSMDSVVSSSNTLTSMLSESGLSMCDTVDDCSSIASMNDTPSGFPGDDSHQGLGADGQECKQEALCSPLVFSEPDMADDFDSDDERSLSRRVTSLVLRDVHDVDVHDISCPERAWDCTDRYLEELTVAVRGKRTYNDGIKETPYTPSKSPTSSNTYNTPVEGQHGEWGNGTGRKRGQSDDQGDQDPSGGDSGDNDEHDTSGQTPTSLKKQKMEENMNFSCPFRKRNPMRFNVRDHHLCATRPFANMSALKKHISGQHGREKQMHTCPRCKKGFRNESELDDHATRDVICEAQWQSTSEDPEDMISMAASNALTKRGADASVRDWKKLWTTLFPMDPEDQIPSSDFVPVVEMQEYRHKLADTMDRLESVLSTQFAQHHAATFQSQLAMSQGVSNSIIAIKAWLEEVATSCREQYTRVPRASEPPTPTTMQSRRPSHGRAPSHFDFPSSEPRRKPIVMPNQPFQRRQRPLVPAESPAMTCSPATTMYSTPPTLNMPVPPMSASPSPVAPPSMEYPPVGYSSHQLPSSSDFDFNNLLGVHLSSPSTQQFQPPQGIAHQGMRYPMVPQYGTPQQGMLPQQGMPQQGMSQQGISQQGISQQGISQQGMLQQRQMQQANLQQGMLPHRPMPFPGYRYDPTCDPNNSYGPVIPDNHIFRWDMTPDSKDMN